MIPRDRFAEETTVLRVAMERRRRKYLRYYYAGVLLATLLLAAAFFSPVTVLSALQRTLTTHAALKASDIAVFRIFAAVVGAGLVIAPVASYRGERRFLVERAVFARILGCFGDFVLLRGGALHAADIRKSALFVEPLLFLPEEGAMGEIDGIRVRLCTAAFFRRTDAGDRLVYNGLLVRLDSPAISETTGEKPIEPILAKIAALLSAPPAQVYWDEKLLYATSAFYKRLKDSLIARLGKNELPAEKAYRLKYAIRPHFSRPCAPCPEDAIIKDYAFDCSQGSCLMAISGQAALFTLGSLFTPAFSEARIERMYEVMQNIVALAGLMRL